VRKPSKYKLSIAVKVHIESAMRICQPLPHNDPLVCELMQLWAAVDNMGRRSRDAIEKYHENKKLRKVAAVVNPERPVAVLTVES